MSIAADVARLGEEVWAWRERTAFRSADDIPRMVHDPGWLPRFDKSSVDERLVAVDAFLARLAAIDVSGESVPVQVDARLIGSAIRRVQWDCGIVRSWERDANFLVSQLVGPYFDLLLPRPPFGSERQRGLVAALAAIPSGVRVAKENLGRAGVADLAHVAIHALDDIEGRLPASVEAVGAQLSAANAAELTGVATLAAEALVGFREWLVEHAPRFADPVVIGRERFLWYLRHVALIAAEPEEIARSAEQEYRRAVVWEAVARSGEHEVPRVFESVSAQVRQQRQDELDIRDFYERRDLLTQAGYEHYLVEPVPAYLAPLSWFGVNDDLTDAARPGTDGVAYTPDPGPELPYFYAANATDPRLGIIHEGTHYQQLVRAWSHENPLRRHYVDSVANEGIAFYNEELMLQAGLFADAPHSRTVVQNFMRLRALRVVVDVSLATGAFTLEQGVEAFVTRVPMDVETAREETAMYVATPGLAMSYQVGKLQLTAMLADYVLAAKGTPDLRSFHDWVWRNGNLPFSLQRWELLGDRSEVDVLDAAEADL